jgi:hypothetical protein
MNRDEQIDVMLAKIKAGVMTYEDTADLFMLSMIGQGTGVTRDEILAKARERFQDVGALNAFLRDSIGQFEAMIGLRL